MPLLFEGLLNVDIYDSGVRVRASEDFGVEHPRKDHVSHVGGRSLDLERSIKGGDRFSNHGVIRHDMLSPWRDRSARFPQSNSAQARELAKWAAENKVEASVLSNPS